MKLDAHHHLWSYDPVEYPWIDPVSMSALVRDFLPADLEAEQRKVGFDGSIAVQARQTLEESRRLLELADAHPRVKGVVGWVDLRSTDVDDQLARFGDHPKFVGVRHVVQDEPDERFLLRPDFLRGLERVHARGLRYDILIFPKQLPAAIEMVKRFPGHAFVLDHIAKPAIKDGVIDPWADRVRELASFPNLMCKISGMVTEAHWTEWKAEDFVPYLDVVADAFGEDRLMIGTDWPVCELAATYEQVVALETAYFETWPEAAKTKIFGENAARFYGLV